MVSLENYFQGQRLKLKLFVVELAMISKSVRLKKKTSGNYRNTRRVIDLMNQGLLRFDETRYLVLDEADEMLNMGFLEDVQLILENIKNDRNIWMFSATMPKR